LNYVRKMILYLEVISMKKLVAFVAVAALAFAFVPMNSEVEASVGVEYCKEPCLERP
jgi:hypothetical protein